MVGQSAESAGQPPLAPSPRDYNAAVDLIDRNLEAGRGKKIAIRDDRGAYSYGDLAERGDRLADLAIGLGVAPEQRILLCLRDGSDFAAAFLGAIKAGNRPGPLNTRPTRRGYA